MRLLEKEQNRSFSLMVMFSIENACANVKRFRNTTVCNSDPSSFVQAVQLILKKTFKVVSPSLLGEFLKTSNLALSVQK